MELNAVAGRGDDPSIVLRNYAGGLGSQSLSLSHRPQARDNRNPSGGMPDRDDDGFDFSMNDRFAVPRHLQQQQQQHTGGAEGLRSVEPANLTRSEGFMPAGLAPGRDSSPGEGRSAEYLENSRAGPTGYGGYNVRGGIGFETHAEHSAAAVAHAPTWRPSVEPPGIGSRGGSRWGVFASDEAALVLKKRQGPDQQVRASCVCMRVCLFLGRARAFFSKPGWGGVTTTLVCRFLAFLGDGRTNFSDSTLAREDELCLQRAPTLFS